MREIKNNIPNARFVGVGGPAMIKEGMDSWFEMDRFTVNAFAEPIKRLPEFLRILLQLRDRLVAEQPACFIGVDYNFFNLLLEGMLRKRGIKTVHYVSPTIWAWRSGRIKRIARSVDLMLCLYPFETEIYKQHGVGVRFVGHPKAREISPEEGDTNQSMWREQLGLQAERPVIAILPGSRRAEVGYSGPDFFDAAKLIVAARPDCQFIVPAANEKRKVQIESLLTNYPDLDIVVMTGQSREVMTAADVVLANSGTATLEAMLLKKPMVMSYRLGKITYAFVSRLVKTDYFALPNVLAGRQLIPEFIQDAATPKALADAVLNMLNPDVKTTLVAEFDSIHRQLGINAGSEAADAVLELMGNPHVST